jgi:hypothetical protein
MTAPGNLPEWLRPTPAATGVTPRVIRVAVLARTSTDDQQDPTLSIPRQYGNCERALLPKIQMTLVFYDVETSRKELGQRGSSTSWRKFDIPIRRDGGIDDLLAEATSPDQRFDVVICESIDRIARFTYQGTQIEHDLELRSYRHGGDARFTETGVLTCRIERATVTAFGVAGGDPGAGADVLPPLPDLTAYGIPAALPALLVELASLDPGSAPDLAALTDTTLSPVAAARASW